MVLPPSPARQLRMLELLREKGLLLASHDQPVLRYLQLRRQVRALPLHDIRGKITVVRAWQITDAGVAAALRLAAPKRRRRGPLPAQEQIDLEEAIATSSGSAPECAPLPGPDTPTEEAVDVSAHQSRSVETAGSCRPGARGAMPELQP